MQVWYPQIHFCSTLRQVWRRRNGADLDLECWFDAYGLWILVIVLKSSILSVQAPKQLHPDRCATCNMDRYLRYIHTLLSPNSANASDKSNLMHGLHNLIGAFNNLLALHAHVSYRRLSVHCQARYYYTDNRLNGQGPQTSHASTGLRDMCTAE